MTLVIPSSINNVSLIPGAAFTLKKSGCLVKCGISRKLGKHPLSSQRLILPLSTSLRLFPACARQYVWHSRRRNSVLSATRTDVALEEQDSPITEENSGGDSETQSDTVQASEKSDTVPATSQSRRTKQGRKSEMPLVKNEDLVPGATFTGKVRAIQPFGAFIDFGAFTDGLVHVSRLSDSFVKDVSSVVSIGQEVKVRLVEADFEAGRISLSMRENDEPPKRQTGSDKPRPARKNTSRAAQKKEDLKTSKFVKGQELEGKVKNLTRSGAFISLPEGDEGFLPTSEEADDGLGSMMGASSLQVGQDVSVRVLRTTRGQVTLTMKKEDDGKFDETLSEGVVYTATNPFVLAFRGNKDIAAFLDKREEEAGKEAAEKELQPSRSEKAKDSVASSGIKESLTGNEEADKAFEEITGQVLSSETSEEEEALETKAEETLEKEDLQTETPVSADEDSSGTEVQIETPVAAAEATSEKEVQTETITAAAEDSFKKEVQIGTPIAAVQSTLGKEAQTELLTAAAEGSLEREEQSDTLTAAAEDTSDKEAQTELLTAAAEATSEKEEQTETFPAAAEDSLEKELQTETPIAAAEDSSEEVQTELLSVAAKDSSEKEKQTETPITVAEDSSEEEAQTETLTAEVEDSSEKEVPTETPIAAAEDSLKKEVKTEIPVAKAEHEEAEKIPEENRSVVSSGAILDFPPVQKTNAGEESIGSSNSAETTNDQISSSEIQESEEFEKKEAAAEAPFGEAVTPASFVAETSPKENGNATSSDSSSPNKSIKGSISPALVKQLREETGAGMMDCKKALSETGGDIVKAQEYLRKKGLASAEKKASRATAEGRIGAYIHDSRIGVLLEVNCETDFVSRGDIFKELVDDLAMQVAACPQVEYLVTEDVAEDIVKKERELEMQKEDLLSKPEQIRDKIVEGRVKKRLEALALLEQPYIKNDKVSVKDWVKETIATVGENIKVKRFIRYNLGEGLEKKSQDFAAEVAAQTTTKPKAAPAPEKEQPEAEEPNEAVEKPATVAVSAALVKQLREETGAGMMDCKKALAETGGDLEKAQEYLRKKGLSSADKKSSRLAAEGRIGSYIHDSRIGVLIEVNCETDFVGRSEKFKELVDDLAMQAVANPQVQYVSIEDIPEDIRNKEKEIEMQREDILSKPENIREKIVEGRVNKRLGELALLEQPYIKDDSILVKDLVKQTVAAIGENIKVRRFARFTLGEDN